jgi:hypothetical protein
MTGTVKQIEYAADLMAQYAEGVATWKAMIPADNPKATALIARIDSATAKAQALAAGTIIDILKGRRDDQATGEALVRWTALAVKLLEAA